MQHDTQNPFMVAHAEAFGIPQPSPPVDVFASPAVSDSERILRLADDMDGEADMLVSDRAGARMIQSAARQLRRYARKR